MQNTFIRVRVWWTDYGSSWVRGLTWALLPGGELFAPAPAEEREPRQLQRVQQSLPYKTNSIKSLWDWIPNIANDRNMVFGPSWEIP